jgi:hypothetical protein
VTLPGVIKKINAFAVSLIGMLLLGAMSICDTESIGAERIVLSQTLPAVPLYGIFEMSRAAGGRYQNPYTEVVAQAEFQRPGGGVRCIELFWDGGNTFTVRFSPDAVGVWHYRIRSSDSALDNTAGSFEVCDSNLKGGLLRQTAHPNHFEKQDGTPFYFFGDTQWSIFSDNPEKNHNRKSVTDYIDRRAAQGFNVITGQLLHALGWDNSGGPPFYDFKSEIINPAYWQEVDIRLQYMNARGVCVGLLLAWASSPGYDYRRFGGLEAALRYVRYIVARYSAYDVYFICAGEFDELYYDWNRIGEAIAKWDPHERMIGIHATSSSAKFATKSWSGFGDYQQIYGGLYENISSSRTFDKPVVNAEYGYFLRDMDGDGVVDKPNSQTVDEIRKASWEIAMAGGYFITGFGSTYFGGENNPDGFRVDDVRNIPWEVQAGFLKEIFSQLEWWKLRPDNSAVSSEKNRPWVLAETGGQYLVYFKSQGFPFKIVSDALTGKRVRVRKINPGNLKTLEYESALTGNALEIEAADGNDWVYLITVVN